MHILLLCWTGTIRKPPPCHKNTCFFILGLKALQCGSLHPLPKWFLMRSLLFLIGSLWFLYVITILLYVSPIVSYVITMVIYVITNVPYVITMVLCDPHGSYM